MADKSFGVKELNLLNASGTPTVTSPNNLNLNANTVAISTSCTIGNNLTVTSTTNSANLNVTGIGTLTRGFATDLSVSGISTISQPSNANPHSLWDVVNNSGSSYRFTGPGVVSTDDNPNIYLVRGQRYIFKVNASGHPFYIKTEAGTGTGNQYTDGVTGNGAQSGNITFNVQHDAPPQLKYQCSAHGSMVGNIYIVGGPQVISGIVTATTFVGNLTGNPTGTLQTAAQPNITSVGTLSALTVSGNINVTSSDPTIVFVDSDNNPDFDIKAGGGRFAIRDSTNNVERTRIDSAGRVLIGTSSSRNVGGSTTNSKLQIEGTSTNTSSMSLVNNENSTAAPFVFFGKTRGNSAGESGIVQSGDTLGGLSFIGADSVDTNNRTAEITAVVNGSPANNTIPTNLVFSTSAQNASQLAERFRIYYTNTGNGGIAKFTSPASGDMLNLQNETASGQGLILGVDTSNGYTYLKNNTSSTYGMVFNVNGSERVRITSTGNFGLATSSPVAQTDSSGTALTPVLDLKGTGSIANESGVLQLTRKDNATQGSCIYNSGDDAGLTMRNTDGNGMGFYNGTILALRVDSNGRMTSLGNKASSQAQQLNNTSSTNPEGVYIRFTNAAPNSASRHFIKCSDNSSDRAVIDSNGNLRNINNSYGGFSDISLKENIVDAGSQWDDIKNIKVRVFNFKTDSASDKRIGVVAQEIETVCPKLVGTTYDKDEDGNLLETGVKSVKYSVLYMKAIKALQEAQARIETLESEVAALKGS